MSNESSQPTTELLFSEEEHLIAQPVMSLNGAVIGWGLFARRAIAPGETVIQLDWSDEERSEILSWDDTEEDHHNRCVAIAPRWYFYVGKQHPLWYINHSCNANVAFKDWAQSVDEELIPLVALRAIQPGEQLTLDYSFTIASDDGLTDEDAWTMECLCGEANCRGLLTCFIQLPRELQQQEMLRRVPLSGTIPAFILNEAPELVAELARVAPDLYEPFQAALASQLRLAEEFEADYDPDEPYYLVEGEPTDV